jgi:hypothetical protein
VFAANTLDTTGLPVAIKVMFNAQEVDTKDLAEDFRQDYALNSDPDRLQFHPNVLRSLGFFAGTASAETLGPSWDPDPEFVRESSMFVVLELLDSSLRDLIRVCVLPSLLALPWDVVTTSFSS